ncbi:MAG TPA: phosphoglucosamine mutase [Thermoanaerobaculia bacterium]|nr:phosphoglucosamine mutase [Thermoanaerobaculia bacterium]
MTALARELAALLDERLSAGGASAAVGASAAGGASAVRGGHAQVVLGGDTRESTAEICGWLAAGLAAGGAAVWSAGVIPTPGVSFLAGELGADAGVAVSASHNPYPDNGIKLLDAEGFKWSEAAEAELEQRLRAATETPAPALPSPRPPSAPLLPLLPLIIETDLRERYLSHLASTVAGGGPALAGLRVVLDTGNGAASAYAGELFGRLGAEVTRLGAAPDGRNVNLGCGSTAPEGMAAAVVAAGAHLGAAFDGDADRCILVDERGEVRDGDAILYLWATQLLAEGRLAPPAIVATSMSNLGLERALARHGIAVVRCGVGDRLVVETMRREGLLLGGEQSGHIVRLDLAATGDGLLTAVQMAALVHSAGRPLSELLAEFRRYPQTLVNVRVARKPDLATLPRVTAAARAVEDELGADGRLVLRYSGTEPLARVMIEGPDQQTIETLAGHLAAVLADELGQPAG